MENGHLSIEEIEQFIQQKGPAESQSHLATCQQCKSSLEDCQAVSAKLEKLASVRIGAESAMNCPDERVWFDVAAGTLPETESLQHVQHASDCSSCGQKLRNAMRLFEGELSEEEEQTLNSLPSNKPAEQQKLARELAKTKAKNSSTQTDTSAKKRFGFVSWRWFTWAAATAGLAVVVLSSLTVYRQHELHEAEETIANAYRRGRPMEYRVAGVPYGPVQLERGAPSVLPSIQVPEAGKVPVLAAQAAFLERDSASAIIILENARRTDPNSLLILDNLVVAYAIEAERTGIKANYERALQISDEIIHQDISNSTVYFNRALIFERQNRMDESLEAVKQFLRFERDASWRSEAEKKMP